MHIYIYCADCYCYYIMLQRACRRQEREAAAALTNGSTSTWIALEYTLGLISHPLQFYEWAIYLSISQVEEVGMSYTSWFSCNVFHRYFGGLKYCFVESWKTVFGCPMKNETIAYFFSRMNFFESSFIPLWFFNCHQGKIFKTDGSRPKAGLHREVEVEVEGERDALEKNNKLTRQEESWTKAKMAIANLRQQLSYYVIGTVVF